MHYPEMAQDIVEEFQAFPGGIDRVALRIGNGFGIRKSRYVAVEGPKAVGGRPCKVIFDQHGNRYLGAQDAMHKTGVAVATIWKVLNGFRKASRGYQFHYEGDEMRTKATRKVGPQHFVCTHCREVIGDGGKLHLDHWYHRWCAVALCLVKSVVTDPKAMGGHTYRGPR